MRLPLFLADAGARGMTLLEPEKAHRLTIKIMGSGVAPALNRMCDPRLETSVAGIKFINPLGLAAGFDKNAEVPNPMLGLGFGFVEIGAVTPRPQSGNPGPRVFRLRKDRAVINRYGFNNEGLDAIVARLSSRPRRGVVGANLGANKDSLDRAEDYAVCLRQLDGLVDFYTINISSPNTPGLRTLQSKASLLELMDRVFTARDSCVTSAPIFLKIAPDLTDAEKTDIVDAVCTTGIDGLIISNTTVTRSTLLKSTHAKEAGGLSGAPLFHPSTVLVREFYGALKGAAPIIAVGGVSSGREAYQKILAGGALVQLYTGMVYQGPGLAARILRKLPEFLEADGFSSIGEAVGAECR